MLFTGRWFEEGALLRVALAYEKTAGWHKKNPKVDGA